MKKIIVLLLVLASVISLVACSNQGEIKDEPTENVQLQDNSSNENVQTDNDAKWDILYNLDDFSKEWWNSTHETFASNTNKECLAANAYEKVGYLFGALSIGTMDLEIPVYTEVSTHVLKLTNNKFVFPQEIHKLDNREYGNDNLMDFCVLTRDFTPCKVRLDFSNLRHLQESGKEIKEGEWVIYNTVNDNSTSYWAVYVIDEHFCLNLHVLDTHLLNDEENYKHLVEELCALMQFEDFESNGNDYVKYNHESIALAEKIHFITDKYNIVAWHSGYDGHNTFASTASGSRLDLVNNSGQDVVLKEFSAEYGISEQYYTSSGYMLEKYDYNGYDIFIIRNDPEQMTWAKDQIQGFYFDVNGTVYEVTINEYAKNPEDVDEWISALIDGILIFK